MAVRLIGVLLVFSISCAAATFGTVVPLVGGAADIVLDEGRSRLYLVNSSQSRVEVYSIPQRRFLAPVRTDALPFAAALSRSGKLLYVASFDGSALNIIDLDTLAVIGRVSLPAKPEGVAVGNDERVLISTIGTGANNLQNVLLIYDPAASETSALAPVQITPPAPASPLLPPPSGRIFLAARSQLQATRDGSLIIGVNIPNPRARSVFVFEVASGTVLRSRSVLNISSVLSVSPDNSKFMSGLTLFDTSTLEVLAQQNTANAPYPFQTGTNFNLQQNQGGSVFAPDGSLLYSAFNIAPVQNPPARPNVSQFLLNDADNLLIRLGIQLPENLAGAMVITSDGGAIYAISESGFTILPIAQLAQSPIAVPESTSLLLANDQCDVTSDLRNLSVPVRNEGRGRMTVSAQLLQLPPTGPGGIGGGGAGGGAPGGPIIIIVPPAPPGTGAAPPGIVPPGGGQAQQNQAIAATAPTVRARVTPDGAQLDFSYTRSPTGRLPGTVSPTHTFLLQSNEAINIPPAVRVFQNFRNSEARAGLVPITVGMTANEGLVDMAYDAVRQRVYIANSALNRLEVFDVRSEQLLEPIKVGQLPRSIALTPDGSTLYVANTGGETISIVNLETMEVTGRVRFPALPFNFSAALVTPSIIAASLRGPLVIMSNGTIWSIVGGEAVPRRLSPAIGANTVAAPRTMTATPNGDYILLLAGNGFVYLYDALADEFVTGRQIFTPPIRGYYGPVAAGPRGQYYLANGTVLNQALTPVGTAGTVNVPGPVRPGQPPATTTRPIASVSIASSNTFVRFAMPVRANANQLLTEPPSVELVDMNGRVLASASALEGPLSALVGNQRVNVNGRTMVVDDSGSTAYVLTTSGLSIVPLEAPGSGPADRPVINQNGTVSLSSYVPAFAPGGLISIFGRNLGEDGSFSSTPLPTILGGMCVTLNNQPLPLFMTSAGQINAQIPPGMAPGRYPLVVRSIAGKSASPPQQITVARYAPAVFTDPETNYAAIYRLDGQPVTRDAPAHRDDRLMIFATGLGATKGGSVAAGEPAPADPAAVTDAIKVFFGDPSWSQAELLVEWSGLVPGFIGVYQINVYIPGNHMRGEALPVTLRMGTIESQKTGPAVPTVAVD
ncbi:MAG: hypothetical protein HYS04_10055 [Acidobacteria bacterium]|nr:hypothetical protein [Acidobacteriota bacterium]